MTYNSPNDSEDNLIEPTIKQIIDYWDRSLLCSLESSTSLTDPNLAFLDNKIENMYLFEILSKWSMGVNIRCLDVGAGYGRFVQTLKHFYNEIVLLEAAERIFNQLQALWQNNENIECIEGTFETLNDERKYDLIFASGVIYLYNDVLLDKFIKKAVSILSKDKLLILRDFIADPGRVLKSNYIENGFCYYRSLQFWREAAPMWDLEVMEIRRSKPQIKILREPKILSLANKIGVAKLLKHPRLIRGAIKWGNYSLQDNSIHTVFIVMRVL